MRISEYAGGSSLPNLANQAGGIGSIVPPACSRPKLQASAISVLSKSLPNKYVATNITPSFKGCLLGFPPIQLT